MTVPLSGKKRWVHICRLYYKTRTLDYWTALKLSKTLWLRETKCSDVNFELNIVRWFITRAHWLSSCETYDMLCHTRTHFTFNIPISAEATPKHKSEYLQAPSKDQESEPKLIFWNSKDIHYLGKSTTAVHARHQDWIGLLWSTSKLQAKGHKLPASRSTASTLMTNSPGSLFSWTAVS